MNKRFSWHKLITIFFFSSYSLISLTESTTTEICLFSLKYNFVNLKKKWIYKSYFFFLVKNEHVLSREKERKKFFVVWTGLCICFTWAVVLVYYLKTTTKKKPGEGIKMPTVMETFFVFPAFYESGNSNKKNFKQIKFRIISWKFSIQQLTTN